jgi:hypothetical protein
VSRQPNDRPVEIRLPDSLPPISRRAARALFELIEALANSDIDGAEEPAA